MLSSPVSAHPPLSAHRRDPAAPGAPGAAPAQVTAADALQLRLERELRIDAELAQSFPASDPPGWTMGVALPPPLRDPVNQR